MLFHLQMIKIILNIISKKINYLAHILIFLLLSSLVKLFLIFKKYFNIVKNLFIPFILSALLIITTNCKDNEVNKPDTKLSDTSVTTHFDDILFYDGYAEQVDYPTTDGTIRIANYKYVKKLSYGIVEKWNNNLTLEVIVKAGCDNYDRIGNVFLSFIDKGKDYSKSNIVKRIEVARFITPFMDKNKLPNKKPYYFQIDNIARLLKEKEYSQKYDYWIEFDIFGTTSAGKRQITGCADKNFTFFGTLKFKSIKDSLESPKQYFQDISTYYSLNNSNNSDEEGRAIKTFNFEIEKNIKSANVYLITSNHGANENGEEYVRREHYIYFDGNLIAKYKPGGKSCEPFRKYNTQGNGIYGPKPRTDKDWTDWNNWCPGDKIPIRVYNLGNVAKGNHTFKIDVPDAKFVNGEGYFPVSAYIQGDAE